jgi:Zn-dependent M28 family amino/carboxypeptidase
MTPVVDSSSENGYDGQNVYVDIPGATIPNEMVLLSAHHDAWFSGADDNASGIAVLLEAARVLKDARPDRTIRIIAFDIEEYGLIGANRYLDAHGSEGLVAVVNLDCVSYASHAHGSQTTPTGLQISDVGDFIAVLANTPATTQLSQVARLSKSLPLPVEVVGLVTPDDGYYPGIVDFLRSDHAPFWRRGVPALFVTDTASFRNANYHTATDTMDTLDYDFFLRSAQLVVGAVRAFATR